MQRIISNPAWGDDLIVWDDEALLCKWADKRFDAKFDSPSWQATQVDFDEFLSRPGSVEVTASYTRMLVPKGL